MGSSCFMSSGVILVDLSTLGFDMGFADLCYCHFLLLFSLFVALLLARCFRFPVEQLYWCNMRK